MSPILNAKILEALGYAIIGILRTTYLVNEDGAIERIMGPKEIKTKIHAEQIIAAIA